jgi:hypothetical protein
VTTVTELVNQLRSPENKTTLQAVEKLRARGWLVDGSLRGTALCHAQLQGADLMEANLNSVDFHQAQLEWADLTKADLRNTKLTRSNLQGVNFSQADLTRADLYKSNLRGARNLCAEQLSKVVRLYGAIMPDGRLYDGRFNLSGDLEFARWANVVAKDPAAMAEFYGISLERYLQGQQETALAPLAEA